MKIRQSEPVFCSQEISSWRRKSCKQFPPGALQVAKKYCERVTPPLQLAMFFSRHRCETGCKKNCLTAPATMFPRLRAQGTFVVGTNVSEKVQTRETKNVPAISIVCACKRGRFRATLFPQCFLNNVSSLAGTFRHTHRQLTLTTPANKETLLP